MINIAEILKDCPSGTKLYSTIHGEVELVDIYHDLIRCKFSRGIFFVSFHSNGRWIEDVGECVIFPSKDQRDWCKFHRPFKDGDILTYTGNYTTTFIYRNKDNEPHLSTSFYVACNDAPSHNFLIYNKYTLIALNENCDVRLATEDEKIKLFDAIKVNGYKWNAETKTLEKLIVPKFKVGDRVQNKNNNMIGTINLIINDECEYQVVLKNGGITYILFEFQDRWELVPDKFDINTLNHFDKVLVRDNDTKEWAISLFSHYNGLKNYKYSCINGTGYVQCIPYEGNKHLLGTANDCDEYYKNW